MKTAIGYIRVSTEGQAQEGVSLKAQQDKIKAWATLNGYTLLSVHTDAGISGRRQDNRPALQEALSLVCKRKSALVAYSLSRLSRSLSDCCNIAGRLNRAGADLVSLSERIDTTSAMGKLQFHMMAAFGQFTREVIGENTRMAMAHLRKQGRRISIQIPYGHALNKDKKTLSPVPSEQKTIRRIQQQRCRGASLREIASNLTRRGIAPKTGTMWYHSTVRGILRRADRMAKAA